MTAVVVVVLGGTRSGKSAYAEQLLGAEPAVLYVATLRPGDPSLDARIAAHRARRPAGWREAVVGEDGDVAAAVLAGGRHSAVLVDGYELAVALAEPAADADAEAAARATVAALRARATRIACVVSSEVGLGVHPSSEAGGVFRDRVGSANRALAAAADRVVLVVAGLPVALKGTL